jgi:glucose-1-phosphate thymidylyltransferase
MKGIILAGGAGTRLDPITRVASKQLQPVYDKPMIYYPLATLMQSGVREILLISTPDDTPRFEDLLGDGSQWGVSIWYATQEAPGGIAQSFLIAKEFIKDEPVELVLGDNIFHGNLGLGEITSSFSQGALIFGYPVVDPARYGVVEIGADGRALSLQEKPTQPRSNLAVPGLYIYDSHVVGIAEGLRPSARGELEITDVNKEYMARGQLQVIRLGRGIAWLDSGTHDSLLEAANFIATIERRQGLKIACLEEVALRLGNVDEEHVTRLLSTMPQSSYKEYIERILTDTSFVR